MGDTKMATMLTVIVVVSVAAIGVAEGQSTPSCASKLVPCASYMNSTNPPSSCCDPLREAVTNELQCLCNLYETPGLLESFGINVTQALHLTAACKIPGDLSACRATAPTSSSTPPPPGESGNDVGRIASTGASGLLLLWAFMMTY
ncbi:hypothetical protein RJ639_026855 [Escallonia herrerae]|uniref:Bifunctional inhibitor/plant lipid transfer protein/seed storage helical domain-containing protein n=1 Tax=Escallonia herrerae TaxID=1293975 RepID=A0AA88X6X6_9ASTE|nr:hypothetical protein RJ639_026855 [Escallonia herrerae]